MKTIKLQIPDGKRAEWQNGVLTLVDEKPQDVTERIKTFEDALNELGDDNVLVKEYWAYIDLNVQLSNDIIAYLRLRVITAALNEGWTPQFIKGECRWYFWYDLITKEQYDKLSDEDKRRAVLRGGLVYAGAYSASSHSYMSYGSRLAFKSEKLADYAGRQFAEIYADFCFKPKEEEHRDNASALPFFQKQNNENIHLTPHQDNPYKKLIKRLMSYLRRDTVAAKASPHPENRYIDLGLSIKWATCNVGANLPEGYGDYCTYDEAMALDLRLPSLDEMRELIDKCDWEWALLNGVNGYNVTGPNGNSIFLPAAGYRNDTSLYDAGSGGYYWSATPYSDCYSAYDLYFNSGYYYWLSYYRSYGFTVRPVSE